MDTKICEAAANKRKAMEEMADTSSSSSSENGDESVHPIAINDDKGNGQDQDPAAATMADGHLNHPALEESALQSVKTEPAQANSTAAPAGFVKVKIPQSMKQLFDICTKQFNPVTSQKSLFRFAEDIIRTLSKEEFQKIYRESVQHPLLKDHIKDMQLTYGVPDDFDYADENGDQLMNLTEFIAWLACNDKLQTTTAAVAQEAVAEVPQTTPAAPEAPPAVEEATHSSAAKAVDPLPEITPAAPEAPPEAEAPPAVAEATDSSAAKAVAPLPQTIPAAAAAPPEAEAPPAVAEANNSSAAKAVAPLPQTVPAAAAAPEATAPGEVLAAPATEEASSPPHAPEALPAATEVEETATATPAADDEGEGGELGTHSTFQQLDKRAADLEALRVKETLAAALCRANEEKPGEHEHDPVPKSNSKKDSTIEEIEQELDEELQKHGIHSDNFSAASEHASQTMAQQQLEKEFQSKSKLIEKLGKVNVHDLAEQHEGECHKKRKLDPHDQEDMAMTTPPETRGGGETSVGGSGNGIPKDLEQGQGQAQGKAKEKEQKKNDADADDTEGQGKEDKKNMKDAAAAADKKKKDQKNDDTKGKKRKTTEEKKEPKSKPKPKQEAGKSSIFFDTSLVPGTLV